MCQQAEVPASDIFDRCAARRKVEEQKQLRKAARQGRQLS